MSIHTIQFSAGIFLAAANSSIAADFEKVLRHEFPIENPAKIVVEADIGDLELVPSETGMVHVDVLLKISTNSDRKANAAFNAVNAEFLQPEEGTARINVRSNRSGMDWLKFWRKYPDVEVTLMVPEGVVLKIATGAGDVTGGGFSAETSIATGAGDVDITDLNGSISIATGAGDVDLKGFEGSLSAATGAGDFNGSGNFSEFSISTGKGDVELLTDNPVSSNSSVSTGMGDISVGLPVGSSFDLHADVGFGDIATNFDIVDTDPDDKKFRGSYNEGSVKLRFSTGFGDVRIVRR